jgi:nitrite reductase/ring-hydroxylating ferredoxin subunit
MASRAAMLSRDEARLAQPANPLAEWISLDACSAWQNGMSKGYDLRGAGCDEFFLVRHRDQFYAYLNSCPHWPQATLPWRKDAYLDGNQAYIMCYGHGARFTIEQGLCVEGPCHGQYLTAIPCRVREGRVEVLI